MPGLKFVLSEAFTDDTLPILRADPILSVGSLFLFDASHSLGGFGEGVPENDAVVPNVAADLAAAIIGAGDAVTLGGVVKKFANVSVIERTERGGIHGILGRAGQASTPSGLFINPAPLIQQYIHANMDHDLFFSLWGRLTRRQVLPTTAPQSAMHKASNTGNYLFYMQGGSWPAPFSAPALVGRRGGTSFAEMTLGDAFIRNVATTERSGASWSLAGTPAGSGLGNSAGGVAFGPAKFDAWSNLNNNLAPSWILYRAYCEDLTVSGRTYAEVDALDLALFNAAFGEGGRFADDEWTDPETALPTP